MIRALTISIVASACLLAIPVKKNNSAFAAVKTPVLYSDTANLKPGDKFPDITFIDAEGKNVKVDQFKGKYIYIDVWASWCYPCRKEYPKLAELKTRMKDRAIEFIGISCDKRDDKWKGAMRDNKIDGIQWLLKNRDFMHAFKVGTIPRYILLDKKGKILNLNMERPSSPRIDSLLNSLKKI